MIMVLLPRTKALIKITCSLVIFGTLGMFVRFLSWPAELLACVRGLGGALTLLLASRLLKRPLEFPHEKKQRLLLVVSGVLVALNWLFLFLAYEHTSLATAELAYEMAPVFVIAASPLIFKQPQSLSRLVCVGLALVGMVLVSGLFDGQATGHIHPTGILLGLISAAFFAALIICNQFLRPLDALSKTIVQLFVAGCAMIPVVLIQASHYGFSWSMQKLGLVVFIAAVHTGLAFLLWFSSMDALDASSVAILEYIDPLVALAVSTLVFDEHLTRLGIIGAVLVLGSTLASELMSNRRDNARLQT